MGKETNIEWCDSTVNPTDFQCCGCELWNPEQGKKICYSGRYAERLHGIGAFDKPVQLKPGRMARAARWSDLTGKPRLETRAVSAKPWLDNRPRVIFVGDMADTLQPDVPFEYLKTEIIDVVTSQAGRRHVWMWLTKQSSRMVKFARWLNGHRITWPSNLWPGVSITSERTTFRIDDLVKVASDHRFISYEPAFELVDFSHWTSTEKIRLIIMGGCSGPEAEHYPFNIEWAYQTKCICEHDQVDFFLKQLGSNAVKPRDLILRDGQTLGEPMSLELRHKKGGDMSEWPADLRLRQFPKFASIRAIRG